MPYKLTRIMPRGLNEDQLPDASFWSRSDNGLDRDGAVSAVAKDDRGYLNPPINIDVPLYGLYAPEPDIAAGSAQIDHWITAGTTPGGAAAQVMTSRGGVATDITPAIYSVNSDANSYTGGTMNGFVFLNNALNTPKTWDFDTSTPTLMFTITGWFASSYCQWMRRYRDFLICGDVWDGTNRFNDQVRWSDRAAAGGLPTAWTPAATNEAGDLTLGDSVGNVIDGEVMADFFMVYKPESSYRIEEVGLPAVLGARRANQSEGVMARNCIQVIDNMQYVVGNQDIYRTDGRRSESIISPGLRRWFYETSLDFRFRDATYTAYNQQRGEFYVCYRSGATKTYPDMALVFNGDKWGIRELGDTDSSSGDGDDGYPFIFNARWPAATSYSPTDLRLMAVDPDQTDDRDYLLRLEDDNNVIPMAAEVTGITLIPGRQSLMRRIWPLVKRGSGLSVTVGSNDTGPGYDMNWDSAQTWVPGEPIQVSERGRYHGIRIESRAGFTLPDQQCYGFEVEFEEVGTF